MQTVLPSKYVFKGMKSIPVNTPYAVVINNHRTFKNSQMPLIKITNNQNSMVKYADWMYFIMYQGSTFRAMNSFASQTTVMLLSSVLRDEPNSAKILNTKAIRQGVNVILLSSQGKLDELQYVFAKSLLNGRNGHVYMEKSLNALHD